MTTAVIPPWNFSGVLPPFMGSPTGPARSPYSVKLSDFALHFSTSLERRKILLGFLDFRARLHGLGLVTGFQWLDGSFLEDVEALEGRPPNDLDVVTFFQTSDDVTQKSLVQQDGSIFQPAQTKQNYRVDAYFVQLNGDAPELLVEFTSYWYSLWSHRRDQQWKGFLRVDLAATEDTLVRGMLEADSDGEGEQ